MSNKGPIYVHRQAWTAVNAPGRRGSPRRRGWAKQTAVEWPFTSRLLERIAKSYDNDAVWHNTDAT
jgi:hypothetical protein